MCYNLFMNIMTGFGEIAKATALEIALRHRWPQITNETKRFFVDVPTQYLVERIDDRFDCFAVVDPSVCQQETEIEKVQIQAFRYNNIIVRIGYSVFRDALLFHRIIHVDGREVAIQ